MQVQDLVSDCLTYLKKSRSDQVVYDTFIEAQRLQISSLRTDAIEILIEGPRCATSKNNTREGASNQILGRPDALEIYL